MIKAAIFDLDGVLLDSMGIWRDLGARYLRSRDREPEPGLNELLYTMSMEQGAEYLRDHYELTESTEDVMNGLKKMLEDFYYYEVSAKPGTLEMLSLLASSGIRMVLATSSPRLHVEHALKRLGLLHFFERIFTTGEVGVSKHEPKIYLLAAEHLQAKPEETAVLEDTFYALMTAKNAGFYTVGVYDVHSLSSQAEIRAEACEYVGEGGWNEYIAAKMQAKSCEAE